MLSHGDEINEGRYDEISECLEEDVSLLIGNIIEYLADHWNFPFSFSLDLAVVLDLDDDDDDEILNRVEA